MASLPALMESLLAYVKGSSYPATLVSITCFLFMFLVSSITNKKQHRSNIPTDWPVVGMLPGILLRIHRPYHYLYLALREAGGTAEFRGPWGTGMRGLFTCDPANCNYVLSTNFANFPKGPEFNEIFDVFGDGLFNADHESWKAQRKMAQALLAEQRFRRFVVATSQDKVRNSVFPLLEQAAEDGRVLDLQDIFYKFTVDATCTLIVGADPSESLSSETMDEAFEALLNRHTVPPSWWKLMRRLGVGKEKKLAVAWGAMDRFIESHISRKKEEFMTKGRLESPDLLSSYVEGNYAADDVGGGGLDVKSNKFLRDTVTTFMLAGRDGIALSLTWLFWLLSTHPRVEAKLLEELNAADLQHGAGSEGPVVDPDKVNSLVYLHACICEAQRLYPPIPFQHKGVVSRDVLPTGHEVRPGSMVLFSLYAMGRMEKVWGKDCGEFKPERWVSESGRVRHEPSYKFLAFNSGPRTCLGKDMALTALKVVAAAVLGSFTVELVEGQEVAVPKLSIILQMKNGLRARVRKRKEL